MKPYTLRWLAFVILTITTACAPAKGADLPADPPTPVVITPTLSAQSTTAPAELRENLAGDLNLGLTYQQPDGNRLLSGAG